MLKVGSLYKVCSGNPRINNKLYLVLDINDYVIIVFIENAIEKWDLRYNNNDLFLAK